jgi:hypothetical protein
LADRARTYAELAPQGGSGLQISAADKERLERISHVFSDLATSLDMTLSTSALRHVSEIKSG